MKATQGQANRQEVLKRTLSAGTHAPAGVVAFDIGAARYEIPTLRERRATESRFVTSRLGVKSQTVVPREVRAALGVGPGDQIGYTIQNGRVILSAIKRPLAQEDPFACFDEWASPADTEGYASL